jgi:uncharacterized membrane protein YedE/YeeE
MATLIYGLLTGVIFGFLLQRARVIRYDKQLGALRLLDMTIVKFMLSAILVSMLGVYLLSDLGLVKLSIKPTVLGGNILGGLIFGVGWGLLGYCPGTAGGALGEGRWDAIWGVLGMLAGAGLYAEAFPVLKKTVLTWGDYGKIKLPGVLGLNHWIVITIILIASLGLFTWLEKRGL